MDGLAIAMLSGAFLSVIGWKKKPRAKHSTGKWLSAAGPCKNSHGTVFKDHCTPGRRENAHRCFTGQGSPSGGLPMDVGCVVSNVGTLKALSEAFREGKPLIERGFTVTGAACTKPNDLYAPIGSVIEDLIPETIDVAPDTLRKILFGGPMMGTSVSHAAGNCQKNTSGRMMTAKKQSRVRAPVSVAAAVCAHAPADSRQYSLTTNWKPAT